MPLMMAVALGPAVRADWLVRVDHPKTLELMQETGLKPVRHYRHLPWVLYHGSEGDEEAFARNKERLGVEAAPNSKVRLSAAPNDPQFTNQLSLNPAGALAADADVFMREAWDLRTSAADVVVALIDSGIDINHQDLRDNLWTNPLEQTGQQGVDDDQNGYIDDVYGWNVIESDGNLSDAISHGTAVSGVLGARGNNGMGIAGACWEVQLMAVRAFDEEEADIDRILAAVDYILEFPEVQIINASWSGEVDNPALRDALVEIGQRQILVVAGAGNEGISLDQEPRFPAAWTMDHLVSVAAIDLMGQLWTDSNFGSSVTVAAPGQDVLSTTPYNNYNPVSGTSYATPLVTGTAALLLAEYHSMSPSQVRQWILSSSRQTSSLAGVVLEGGLLDAQALLQAAPNRAALSWTFY